MALPDPRTIRELHYFVFEEDYTYFSNKAEVCQEELVEMSYQMRRASTVLGFGVARMEDVFQPGHL